MSDDCWRIHCFKATVMLRRGVALIIDKAPLDPAKHSIELPINRGL